MSNQPQPHLILLRSSGHVFAELEVQDVSEGDRDKHGVLASEGGITFRTPKGKAWFLKFSEFSFLINSQRTPENQ